MRSAEVLGDLQEIVKGKVTLMTFDIYEVFNLQLAFCVFLGMRSTLLVWHSEELAVLFGVFDHSRLFLGMLSRSAEHFPSLCGLFHDFNFRFFLDVLFNDEIILFVNGFDFYVVLEGLGNLDFKFFKSLVNLRGEFVEVSEGFEANHADCGCWQVTVEE